MSEINPRATGPISSEMVKEDPSFAELAAQFLEGMPGRLQLMDDAIQNADFERLRVAAHQLKGSGGGYGYPILTERAAELEKHAKSKCLADCAACLAGLREICSRLVVSE